MCYYLSPYYGETPPWIISTDVCLGPILSRWFPSADWGHLSILFSVFLVVLTISVEPRLLLWWSTCCLEVWLHDLPIGGKYSDHDYYTILPSFLFNFNSSLISPSSSLIVWSVVTIVEKSGSSRKWPWFQRLWSFSAVPLVKMSTNPSHVAVSYCDYLYRLNTQTLVRGIRVRPGEPTFLNNRRRQEGPEVAERGIQCQAHFYRWSVSDNRTRWWEWHGTTSTTRHLCTVGRPSKLTSLIYTINLLRAEENPTFYVSRVVTPCHLSTWISGYSPLREKDLESHFLGFVVSFSLMFQALITRTGSF